jgi:hypothetical protein
VGAFTISVSAGQSLEQALAPGGAVASLSLDECLELASLVAACQMLVRHRNDQVVSQNYRKLLPPSQPPHSSRLHQSPHACPLTPCPPCCVPPQADGARMHRDMKPDNMCLRKVGDRWLPVVMDFGAWCRQDKADFFCAFDAR